MAIFDNTRADWNARPPTRPRTTVPWADRIGVSWHWIGPGRGILATSSHSLCLELVNRWQLQHQTRVNDPWKDIGYNALVCQHAKAIEGRGLQYQGSHSPGVNWEHVGVQLMVGDLGPSPSPAMYDRAARLRADIAGLGKNIRRDWSHRDDPQASTTCAGNTIQAWVDSGGPTKSTTPPPPEEEDMPTVGEIWAAQVGPTSDRHSVATALVRAERDAALALEQAKAANERITALVTAEADRYQVASARYSDLVARITNDEDVDPAALAAALAPLLADQMPDSPLLTQQQIEDAFRAVLGSVDNTPEVQQ
jgi:hypothetical protein